MSEDNRKLSAEVRWLRCCVISPSEDVRRVVSIGRCLCGAFGRTKKTISTLAGRLPGTLVRADVPDMAVMLFSVQFEQLRDAMAVVHVRLPEGVTDLQCTFMGHSIASTWI